MNLKTYNQLMDKIIAEVKDTRLQGQKEYARTEDNIFANFDRISDLIDIPSSKVLMTYLYKHIDGIAAYVNGHKSQREDVRGRIKDVIVYLTLLWGMVDEAENLDDLKVITNAGFTEFDKKSGEVKYKE
jgi:hypothetical protein